MSFAPPRLGAQRGQPLTLAAQDSTGGAASRGQRRSASVPGVALVVSGRWRAVGLWGGWAEGQERRDRLRGAAAMTV